MLLYLRLIVDKRRDEDTERLLRYNIVPYFDRSQINDLKKIAGKTATSLFETVCSAKYLSAAKISREQQESLHHHVALISRHQPEDLVGQLQQELGILSDGPLTLLKDQQEKQNELFDILKEFGNMTIKDALDEVQRHITFLEKHSGSSRIVLTTVDHSKSQEFETVFLLGIDKASEKRLYARISRAKRMYVSVSRAKQRLFFVGNKEAFASNNSLSEARAKLYIEEYPAKAKFVDGKV